MGVSVLLIGVLLAASSGIVGASVVLLALLLIVTATGAGDDWAARLAQAVKPVTGKAASLGGRMMTQVADQILNQFGKNFANNVMAMGEGEQAEEAREELTEQPKELNGLAFAWSVIVGFLRGLFGHRKANAG